MDTVETASSLCPHYRESAIAPGRLFQSNICKFIFAWNLTAVGIIGVSARRELPLVDIETVTWASDRGTHNRGREVNIFNPVTGMEIVIGSYIRLYCTHV